MNLNTAVIYGSARQARQGIKAARFIVNKLEERETRFLDEFEWYANAMHLARRST